MPAKKCHMFKPTKLSKRIRVRDFLGYDVETNPDGSFICAALYGFGRRYYKNCKDKVKTSDEISAYFESEKDLQEYLIELSEQGYRFTLVSHNADFDNKYLGGLLDTSTKVYSDSRFVTARLKNGFDIFDTTNYFKQSLASLIDTFRLSEKYGVVKREGYLDSQEGKKEQVMDDARAVYYLAVEIQDFFSMNFGVSLRKTLHATSLAVFQQNYFTGFFYRGEKELWKNDFERKGYYGGRVEAFRRGERRVKSYDVNGMYVSIMANEEFPNPSKAHYLKDSAEIQQAYYNGEYMMIEVTVDIPTDLYIGLIPVRSDSRGGKIIFPTGRITGVYPSIELCTAERYGASIVEFHRALLYPEKAPYFREYAKMTQEGRKKAKAEGNEAFNQLYKLMGNGLYGKFAQINREPIKYIRFEDYSGDIEGKTIKELSDGSIWIIEDATEGEDALHTFPVIPAFVTAFARIKLLNAIMANSDSVVYCDTDSIKIDADLGDIRGITVSKEPGDWSFEYESINTIYGLKMYDNHDNDNIIRKRKGVPKKAKLISKTDEFEVYEYEAPIKFKSSIKRNRAQNFWETIIKQVNLSDNKRVWVGNDSRPIVLQSIPGT